MLVPVMAFLLAKFAVGRPPPTSYAIEVRPAKQKIES
jgi:hypothetical protein